MTFVKPTDTAGQQLNTIYAEHILQLINLLTAQLDGGTLSLLGPVAAPASPPTVTLQPGSLNGAYQWGTYWITGTPDGTGNFAITARTNPSAYSASQTLANQEGVVSIAGQTVPTGVVGWGVVRNLTGGSTWYIVPNSEQFMNQSGSMPATFIDNTVDANLVMAVPSNTTGTGFADTTVKRTSDATASNNYPSYKWQFQRSTWNGSTPVTGTSYLVYGSDGKLHWYNESGSDAFNIDQSGDITLAGNINTSSSSLRLVPLANGNIGIVSNNGNWFGLVVTDNGANKPSTATVDNTLDDGNGNMTVNGTLTANGGLNVPSSQTVSFGVGNSVGQFFTASNPNGAGGGFIEWAPASGMPKVVAFTGAGASALDEFHISTQGLYIDAPINSIAGQILGTLYWVMDLRGSVKRVVISLVSFDNTSDQQFTLPVAFSNAATMLSTVNASMTIKTYNNGALVTTYSNVQNAYEPLPGPFNAISIQVGTANGTIIIEGM